MTARMTDAETVELVRTIKAGWPFQKFDADTVDMWAQSLRDTDPPMSYADCRKALLQLVVRGKFAGPQDIVTTVRAIRDARLAASDVDTVVPNVDPDDPRAYNAELRAIRTAVADGTFDADAYAAGGLTLSGATPLHPGPAGTRRVDPAQVEGLTGRPS